MLTRVRDVVIAAATRAWLSSSSGSWRRLPRPSDEPHVHGAGSDPHRVLVMGNGIAMSYGVLSHQIGFGGHLARQLAERTGRGSDVQLIVDTRLDPRTVLGMIADVRPARFDAIVLTLGGAEAMGLTPALAWRRDLDRLLDRILAETTTTEIVLVSVPEIGRVVRIPGFALHPVHRRTAELNQHAHLAAARRERATYLHFEPTGTDIVRTRDRTTYEEWGSLIASGLAGKLGAAESRERTMESDGHDRTIALTELGILDRPDDGRFAQITETARALFGVASASINFLDDDRQWTKSVSGGTREDVARADAFCDVTVRQRGLFVVHDALASPRFRELPMVLDGRVRFYAGYPIETPDGVRIGALCVMDPVPRRFSRQDEVLLRELALRAQAALRAGAAA